MLFINKLFNSIACLLSFTNLQLVIPARTWILLYLGRTVYKRLWACLALYCVHCDDNDCDFIDFFCYICSPRNISGEPSTPWAHTGKLSTVLLKLKLWDSQPLAAKPMAKYHISVVFSIKLLLKLIWLKVSSVFNLGQRQQWDFPSLSCGAWHQHLSGSFQQRS